MPIATTQRQDNAFGQLLQHWRRTRGKSQLSLALDAQVSPRHVSFVETGRSSPSREMVITLANALHVPLREQNALLLAAGYAPAYRETRLDAPELEPARRALELILAHQEPHPAVVMNRHWDIVSANRAAQRFFALLLADSDLPENERGNVVRLIFDPRGVRPYVSNWESVAEVLIQRVHREAVGGWLDSATTGLIEKALSYPGVPQRWRTPDLGVPLAPFIPLAFQKGDLVMRYFSAVTTLGTPQDITLQELRVECFFPADAETERRAGLHLR